MKSKASTGEMKIYGFHACMSLWQQRRSDIIRVYLAEERMRDFGPLLKWCAANKKAYHIIDQDSLAKVAASVHHEGVCILTREPRRYDDDDLLTQLADVSEPTNVLYLDGVQNPHNVGSILRVAAHFGVNFIAGAKGLLPRLSPSAARVAEGGFEHTTFVDLHDPVGTLQSLQKQGYQIITTSSHEGTSLYQTHFPARAIVVLGSEVHGVSAKIAKLAQHQVRIPGTGHVESLNVSVACGLLLGEFFRQHKNDKPHTNDKKVEDHQQGGPRA